MSQFTADDAYHAMLQPGTALQQSSALLSSGLLGTPQRAHPALPRSWNRRAP
jgi:hypothetical protein